jgi:tetratricopeptide (TPR) repeat protein
MTVGLPGTGIGGMFYMLSALAMPLIEAYRRARARPSGAWRVMAVQIAITAGILSAMGATGWLVVKALTAARLFVPPMIWRSNGLPPGSVLRTAMLVLTLGTLAAVLVGVELLRLWVHRHANRDTPVERRDACEPLPRAERRAAPEGGGRLVLLVVVTGAVVGTNTTVAQRPTRVVTDLARADSAYRSGDVSLAARGYATVLAADPNNSHATYRLAQLRVREPREALRLFRLYVMLEPADPWGYMAVAEALAEAGKYDEALQSYGAALRLVPQERDAVVGRAHILAEAGRTDAARAAYRHWVAAHPGDAATWRELARLDLRAGRPGDAAQALRRVQALAPDPNVAKLLAAARGAAAPAVTPLATGSRDSDGNTTLRVGGAAELSMHGPTRFGLIASRWQVGAGATTAGLEDLALQITARPQAAWRLDGTAGATRIDPSRGEPGTVIPTSQLRGRWRAPGARTAVDIAAQRSVLDATPVLLANRVVRTELGGMLELPAAQSVKIRGIGRFATLSDSAETNHRTTLAGVVALAVTPSVEISAQFHQTGYTHASSAGYFAPRRAQRVEAGSYFEFETPGSVLLACDLGVGVGRVAQQGAPVGPWRRAFRLYALFSVPLAPGRDLRLEFDGEDSGVGNEAATSPQWRYATAALSLRWAVL